MYAQILKNSFDRYFKVSLQTWTEFAKLCTTVTFEKEEVIKKANSTERNFYFILKGSAGILIWGKNNSVCLDISLENNFFCDYMSLLTRQASPLETISFEKSEMLSMPRKNFFELSNRPLAQKIFRIAAEASFIDKQKQQIELLTKTAQERYQILIEKFPEVIKRIPQKFVASYLGITPQSLSRLRKNVK